MPPKNALFFSKIQDLVDKSGEVFLDKNSDFDIKEAKKYPDGFLYFEYLLEISINEKSDEILIINNVLNYLWDNHIPAIASCDFEDKLDKKGGYKDLSVSF